MDWNTRFARFSAAMLVLAIFTPVIPGYNLELRDGTANYIKSPVMRKLGYETPSGQSRLPDTVRPSFFGYTFTLNSAPDGTTSMIIGSPKTIDPEDPTVQDTRLRVKSKPEGNVLSYRLERDLFTGGQPPNPSTVHPPGPEAGDYFGLRVPVRKDGKAMACSPIREQRCGSFKYNPGVCYKSSDFGATWAKDERTKALACPAVDVEVLFVLDGSGSVDKHFETVKSWVKTIARKLNIEAGNITVGVVQYSHYNSKHRLNKQKYIVTEIRIGQFVRYSSFANAVESITLQGYTTYTGAALRKVAQDFKATKGYGKSTTKQVMVLLTDGRATDSATVAGSAKALRDLGIIPYAVGVGAVNKTELRLIANGNVKSDSRVFAVQSFSALDAIARELQTEIQNIALEGGDFEMQFGEVGLSGAYSKKAPVKRRITRATSDFGNGGLYLGAVGAYDWSGAVIKYDSVTDETADIPKYVDVQQVLPNRTKESYMGYSVTTGFFRGGSTEYVATGAPRYNLTGAVVVYRPQPSSEKFHDAVTLMGHPTKRQLGSYFGGSVLTVDVNNDGKDDLLVGAPLYVGEHYDEGRVFAYITPKGSSNPLTTWERDTYEPLELAGNLEGGRFGTAMADAGDLNKDGFNDVIIGAPLVEGDRGAVFVYHGGTDGLDVAPKQKILASELTGVSLKYFGQAVQGGIDLDGNQYPDVAVGAPKSDTVVIFRSRPVVQIDATIAYETQTGGGKDIDIFECIDKNYENCTAVTVCFTATGVSIEDEIGLRYNLTLDTDMSAADKRLEFRTQPGSIAAAATTLSKEVHIRKGQRTCSTEQVHMKTTVGNYDARVKSEVKFDLLAAHTAKPLSSVRDPNEPNTESTSLTFVKRCGADAECRYDLRLEASMTLPPFTMSVNGEQQDLSAEKYLIVDSTVTTPVLVKVNLTNRGENAFDTRVAIVYSSQISVGTVLRKISSTPTNSCVVADTLAVDLGNGLKRDVLRYNYRTNIMRPGAWCYFEFNLVTTNLRNFGNLENFLVNVTAYTTDSSKSSTEVDTTDNSWQKTPGIKYRSDFTLTKKSVDIDIPFNTTTEEENITSVMQIGQNTTSVEMKFDIKGDGHSNIPLSQVALTWPAATSTGDPLLYLYRVDCDVNSGNTRTKCTCDQSKINHYGLTVEAPNENNTNGTSVAIVPSAVPVRLNTSDCFSRQSGKNHTCETLLCNVTNLEVSAKVVFSARFRLWTPSILFNGSGVKQLEFRSRFKISTALSPLIVNRDGSNVTIKQEQIITTSKEYKAPEKVVGDDNLWIYILAAIGGLLLLIAIIVILWKVGFFKSKYADMKKDAEGDLADETAANGNSTADMMEE